MQNITQGLSMLAAGLVLIVVAQMAHLYVGQKITETVVQELNKAGVCRVCKRHYDYDHLTPLPPLGNNTGSNQ